MSVHFKEMSKYIKSVRFMRFLIVMSIKMSNFAPMKRLVSMIPHTLLASTLIVMMCQCTLKKNATPVAQAVAETPDGSFWVATDNGLFRADSLGVLRQQPLPSLTHHPFPSIHALAVDTVYDRLWVGAWNHLYCYDLKRERFVTTADSAIHQTTALQCDTLGRVLAKTEHGLYRYTLCDTLPDGLTEQMDEVAYKNADVTDINMKGYRFPEPESNSPGLWLLMFLAGIVAGLCLTGLLLWRRRQTHVAPTEELIASDMTEASPSNDILPAKPYFLDRAAQIVDAHIADEDFNADVFAQEMAVSRAQLFRKLKTANGQTPKEFIDDRRMAKAVQLLQTTDRTLADIAMAVGISDASNFRRTFMKRFGVSPSQYRKE